MALSSKAKQRVKSYWEKCLNYSISDSLPGIHYSASGSSGFVNLVSWGAQIIVSGDRDAITAIERSPIARDGSQLFSRAGLSKIFNQLGTEVMGPAFLGYSDESSSNVEFSDMTRPIDSSTELFDTFRNTISSEDWDASGVEPDTHALTGVVSDGVLVALGGYDIWAESIAHICILTQNKERGNGYGKTITQSLMRQAHAEGYIPQFRTLLSNNASIAVAQSLGFEQLATSLAIKLPE